MIRPIPKTISDFEIEVANSVGSPETPSIAYAVSIGGELAAGGAFGFSDVARLLSARLATPYALASVSKPITAAAVMTLIQEGKVQIDGAINPYLGDCSIRSRAGNAEMATVRQTAAHAAGLPLHYQFYYRDEPAVRPPFRHTAEKFAKTFSAPGERFVYSNLGYGLLDQLIENVSGQRFQEFLDQRIFGPLGMENASAGGVKGDEAVSYGPDGVAYPRYDFDHPGGSAIYASATDLLKFGETFLQVSGGPILGSRFIEECLIKAVDIGSQRGWSFGWSYNRDRLGFEVWQHDGGMGGVRTVLRLVPALRMVIVALSNGESPVPALAADELMAIYSEHSRPCLEKERAQPTPPLSPEVDLLAVVGDWKGIVEVETNRIPIGITLQLTGGTLSLGDEEVELESLKFEKECFTGSVAVEIPDPEARRLAHKTHFQLFLRGDCLQGASVAVSKPPAGTGGAKGLRLGNALSFWTDLARV